MACGSGDYACQLISLIARHAGETSELLKWIPWLQEHGREIAQLLITLAGVTFGVLKWWWYREKFLHKRLEEYLSEQDRRLKGARAEVLANIERPGPGRSMSAPLFPAKELRKLLLRRNWQPMLKIGSVETGAQKSLAKAQGSIARRISTAQATLASHQSELATIYILQGAVAAAKASLVFSNARSAAFDREALDAFTRALAVPGSDHVVEALEYQAHQLRRLQRWGPAKASYEALEQRAQGISNSQTRDLTIARAKRHLAELEQAQRDGGSTKAYDLLKDALALLDNHQHLSGWDALERAEMHYVCAYVCHRLGFSREEVKQLSASANEYQRVVKETPRWRTVAGSRQGQLRSAAQQGQERVRTAEGVNKAKPAYDTAWLFPSSKESEHEAKPVSHPTSQQPIQEAAKQDAVDGTKQA